MESEALGVTALGVTAAGRVDESAEIDAANAWGADGEQAFMTCPCVAVQEARREWHDLAS